MRIVGVDLPRDKRGKVALACIYGIDRSSTAHILDATEVGHSIKIQDWTNDQAAATREQISSGYKVEGDLRGEKQLNIERLMNIGCCWGIRHCIGLPLHGQNTKNNARTRKGKCKTITDKEKATK